MKTQVLRTSIEVDRKKFTVETAYHETGKNLISTIHWDDKILTRRELEVTPEMAGPDRKHLEEFISQTHQAFTSDLQSLFTIARKIDEQPTPDKCFMMGILFLSRNLMAEALARFQAVLSIDPSHIQAIKYYGVVLTLQEDYEGAKYVLSGALEAASKYPDIYFCLGNVYLYQRKFKEAKKCYISALQINPAYADAHWKMAACALGILSDERNPLPVSDIQDHVSEAEQEAQLAIRQNDLFNSVPAKKAIGNLREGKFQEAYSLFLEARPKYTTKTGAEEIYFYSLKLLYGEKGVSAPETEIYIRLLEQLVEGYPNYADLRFHFSMAQMVKSNFIVGRSLREMNKAIEANPRFEKARANADLVGDIYKKILLIMRNAYQSSAGE